MEPELRGQPRPARQSRPDPARPGAEDPAAGRLTGARRIPFPITETLHDTQDAQYRDRRRPARYARSEEHTSELQSLMRISYAVFCLIKIILLIFLLPILSYLHTCIILFYSI